MACYLSRLICSPLTWSDRAIIKQPHCHLCHPKATCKGKDSVEAKEGYWRFELEAWDKEYEYHNETECYEEGAVCLFPDEGAYLLGGWKEQTMTCLKLGDNLVCARPKESGRVDTETNEYSQNASSGGGGEGRRALILSCPIGACSSSNVCKQNRTGPVCGICREGYAMNADGCSAAQCPSEDDLRPLRALVVAVVTTLTFVMYFHFWRPVVPEIDVLFRKANLLLKMVGLGTSTAAENLQSASDIYSACRTYSALATWVKDKARSVNRWSKRHYLGQYLKIYVSDACQPPAKQEIL